MTRLLGRSSSAPLAVLAAVLVPACASDSVDTPDECIVFIDLPSDPIASDVPAVATASATGYDGVLTWSWTIEHDGSSQTLSGRQVSFSISSAGAYTVRLASPAPSCPSAVRNYNVAARDAVPRAFRLRVTPPLALGQAPQISTYLDTKNADTSGWSLSFSALPVTGAVTHRGLAAPAYVRFSEPGSLAPLAEVTSDSAGTFSVALAASTYDVLVTPLGAAAPQLFRGRAPVVGQTLRLDLSDGVAVTGVVRGPTGAALGGARVALRVEGIPSTVATSAADGTFSLLARPGTTADVVVTPPAGSGLPRLAGAVDASAYTAGLVIDYAATLTTRDLAGVPVRRAGGAAPGTRVTVVGELPAAGTVSAGGGAARALAGSVVAEATAQADGALGTLRVPAAALSAVLQAAAGEVAVQPFDATAAAPTSFELVAAAAISGVAAAASGVPLAGVDVRLEPRGALAQAGVAPVLARSGASGAFSVLGARGGAYRVVVADPQWRRMSLEVDAVAPAALGELVLPPQFWLRGQIERNAGEPLGGALIELLCSTCLGSERQRVISETLSSDAGGFSLAIPRAQ